MPRQARPEPAQGTQRTLARAPRRSLLDVERAYSEDEAARAFVGPNQPITRKAVDYLRQRLAKPPDGRHDPRSTFGSGLTMERIQTTIYSADWGNPRSLCDLSRETLQLDPHLSSVLTKRFGAVSKQPIDVTPAKGPGIDPERAAFYADVVRTNFDRIPNMRQAVKQLAWGFFDGRAVLENFWARAPGMSHPRFGTVSMVVTGLGWVHPRRIFFGPDRELRVVDRPIGIGFSRDGKAFNEAPNKFIQFTPQLFNEYPEREGLARACLYWCFFKRFSARERNILVELFAKPWRWGEIESEDTDLSSDERADLDTIVEQIAGNGYAVLPRGAKLHVENIAQSFGANGSIHKEVIDQADAQISKLVLGQTGTTDSKAQGLGGSQSEVMQEEQEQIAIDDCGAVAESLEDYLSDAIILVNFGPGALTHAPQVKLHKDAIDRVKELGRLKTALDTGLEVALDEAYEVSGFRKPGPDEPVLRVDTPTTGGKPASTDAFGNATPATPGQARAIIAYPAGYAPVARVQEAPAVAEATPAPPPGTAVPIPGDEDGARDGPGGVPMIPGPLGEDGPLAPTSPEEADPEHTADARGEDPEVVDPFTEPEIDPFVDDETNFSIDAPSPGVATKEDLSDVSSDSETGNLDDRSPSAGQRGVGDYPDPEDADRVPRGVFSRFADVEADVDDLLRNVSGPLVSPRVALVSDAYHVQNDFGETAPEDLRTPEQPKDASPTPEVGKGRTPAAPDVQAPSMVEDAKEEPSIDLPMGPYSDFAECVADQKKKGHSDESAHKICGAIKQKVEGELRQAARRAGVSDTGARRILGAFGDKAPKVFLAMRVAKMSEKQHLVCCESPPGKSPKTVYGSVEPIVKKTTKELANISREWAKKLVDAGSGKTTPGEIYGAVYKASRRISHDDYARALSRRILHAEMLGALDSHFERMTDETIEPAKFDRRAWPREITLLAAENVAKASPTFADLSYKPASEFFRKKDVVPKDVFERLEDGAKARAFTVARMESQELLNMVHAELGRMIAEGADLRQFRKFMNDKIASAGWVPASSSHIDTIARTNLAQAQTVGRLVDSTQPGVLADRPYWQIRGINDDRQRENHKAVDGAVLRADSPFFQRCMPGAFGWQDRCRHATLSPKQVEKRGLAVKTGSEPEFLALPDKGFSAAGADSLLAAFGAR